MGIFSKNTRNTRRQTYFFDDGSFQTRSLLVEHGCLVIKKDNRVMQAWRHFYRAEIPYSGSKGIPPGQVTLGYSRDIILDPFDRVSKSKDAERGKPISRDPKDVKAYIAQIAEETRYRESIKGGSMLHLNKIILGLIAIDVLVLIGIFVLKYSMIKAG